MSGWIQILFPYLKSRALNRGLHPWQEMYFHGPDPDDIPAVISSAPVDWDYNGTTYNLHFQAGFTGCTQDPADGTLTPVMGLLLINTNYCFTVLEAVSFKSVKTCLGEWVRCAVNVIVDLFVVVG